MRSHRHPAYRADIDGLRALAILAVVVFHAYPRSLPGGFVGVDVFFVISGYLIGGIIFKNLDAGCFSFADFYARRAKRIFPALIVVLLGCLGFGWFALLADEYRALGKHVAAGAGFVSNLALWRESGYFDTAADFKPLLHLWSLGIEEQFYLLYPLLMVLAWRLRTNPLVVLALLAGLSFGFNLFLAGSDTVAAFFLPVSRFWELLTGSALAYAHFQRATAKPSASLRHELQAVAGMLLIAAAILVLDKDKDFPGAWALLPTLGALLLIGAGPGSWINRHLLASRPMVFIGVISYPLYLWHWLLLSFGLILRSGEPLHHRAAFLVGAAFLLAWLTYRFVECPVRFGAPAFPRLKLASLWSLLACAGLLGFAVFRLDGLPERPALADVRLKIDRDLPRLAADGYRSNGIAKALFQGEFKPGDDFFQLGDLPKDQPLTAVIGDSHGNMLYQGLATAAARPETVLNLGRGSCLPFIGLDTIKKSGKSAGCQPFVGNAIDFIAQTPNIATVVVAAFYKQYLDGGVTLRGRQAGSTPSGSAPLTASTAELFRTGLSDTLERLVQADKTIVLSLDNPDMDRTVMTACYSLLRPLLPRSPDTGCQMPRARHERDQALVRSLIEDAAARFPHKVRVFDPAAVLCDARYCYAYHKDDLIYQFDGNHLTVKGAVLVAEQLSSRRQGAATFARAR
ncbi:acyltransferase family protein [Methylococcus geothermalis]|uniref:Acyltransferase family protein n=1 Tax=Methylococcus geothermalis TaxID=2681310 RepID=A0A858Q856_9GAMM|nr:acyltransferase family protein [Methylococcus geothermalis]QJD30007.1 acyltransferase family protein [Methylococcus geothermalis]